MNQCEIVLYDPAYDEDFKSLNLAWIEEFFAVEPPDLHYLNNPKSEIMDKGGMIFFALLDEKAVGTVALMKMDGGRYELSKMAVQSSMQGKGIGKQLMDALIAWAKAQGIVEIQLDTNTKLKRALNLYHRTGFIAVPPDKFHSEYTRSNLRMILKL